MLALSISNPFYPVMQLCLVLACSFPQAALVAGGGEPIFSHHNEVLGQDWAGTTPTRAPARVVDDLGLRLIAAEFTADIHQIGSLLQRSPGADTGTGVGNAWPLAPDEWLQGAVHGLIPQPTLQTSLALQALRLPEVPKNVTKKNVTKKPVGKDGAKKATDQGKPVNKKLGGKDAKNATDTGKPASKKPGKKDGAKKAKDEEELLTNEEDLLTSLYLWFAAGSLFISSVLCCCMPAIDPENTTFNFLVDLAIVASVVFIVLDLVNPEKEDHFIIVQHCFTAFFLFEVVVRMRAKGLTFFTEFWGIFDFTLVSAAVIEFWILPIASHYVKDPLLDKINEYAWLPYLLRGLRLLRLLRLFLLFRPESTFRQQTDEKDALDDLAEVWVMIPKAGGKTGKNRGKNGGMAAP